MRRTTGLVATGALGALLVVATAVAPTAATATPRSAAACRTATQPRPARLLGVQPPRPSAGAVVSLCGVSARGVGPRTLPDPTFTGTPPLLVDGGGVMDTTGAVTVTPIYWAPSGFSFAGTYQSLTTQFIADAAHDSTTDTNVFSDLKQYTDGAGHHVADTLAAGTTVSDAAAYPTSGGCTPDTGKVYADGSGYTKCVTDDQIRAQLAAVVAAHSLTTDLSHMYLMYMPKGVEVCEGTSNDAQHGFCTLSAHGGAFCGYHSWSIQKTTTIYSMLPFPVIDNPVDNETCASGPGSLVGGGTVGNQSPNANLDADTSISVTSHEVSESITDPTGTGWLDSSGNEVGDDCAYIYGDTASFGGAAGAEFNQTINGHHYFIQEEFSNKGFASNPTYACVQQALPQTVSFTSVAPGNPAVGTTYKVTATATSALAVALKIEPASASVCSINGTASGSTATFNANGTCRIDASQSGTSSYLPATTAKQVVHAGILDGLGALTASPASTTAGAAHDTERFTYAAGAQGTVSGELDLSVPHGWSPPSTVAGAKGLVTSTCGKVKAAANTIVVTKVTLAGGATCTTTYGARSGAPGAVVSTTIGPATFAAVERSSAGGTLTALAASPVVTVAKAPTTTSLKASATSIKAGHEQVERLSVRVAAKFAKLVPKGKVVVAAGTTTVCTITLVNGQGSCSLAPSRLARGTASLKAAYQGTALYVASTSAPVRLTVT